jgi:hypothetical protein
MINNYISVTCQYCVYSSAFSKWQKEHADANGNPMFTEILPGEEYRRGMIRFSQQRCSVKYVI